MVLPSNLVILKVADVNVFNTDNDIVLIDAVFYAHLGILESILDNVADVNAKNIIGDTALMYAAREF
jgi:ankyrin repeat protein